MTQKHTPGPWSTDGSAITSPARPYYLAQLVGGESVEEVDANARLIAAAPELLEALELCINAMFPGCPDEEWSIAYEKAIATIAKATNQPKE